MKLVVLREQFGPAEQDVLAGVAGWTENNGRKLMRFICDEAIMADPFFLEIQYKNAQGTQVSIWLPNHLVLYIAEIGAAPPAAMGFVGPPTPRSQVAPDTAQQGT